MKDMIGPASRPRCNPAILSQQASEVRLLLNPQDGHYYELDSVGSRVWDLCDGQHRVVDVVSVIGAEYDAPSEHIQRDVVELLAELAEAQLVEIGD